jgi:UDP-GlcNAc3NAcA epimerase
LLVFCNSPLVFPLLVLLNGYAELLSQCNMKKKIITVVGARPQFIKNAPLEMALKNYDSIEVKSIHTGQHYDDNMSRIFFKELGIDEPAYQLNVGSASHGKQTARMLESIEEILLMEQPSMLVVYGDTNSTLAGALAASKLHIPIAHIEAGLRSYNKTMPEEINRVLTDYLSTLLFVPSEVSLKNLHKEGVSEGVHVVGDIMLDTLKIAVGGNLTHNTQEPPYYYATLHRPYNTDDKDRILNVLSAFNALSLPVVFAIHPRTSALLSSMNIAIDKYPNIDFIAPQGYFDNIRYMAGAEKIITDSGGLQKEAWFLKKPCVTLRPETEWIETLTNQWNILVFEDLKELKSALEITPGKHIGGCYGEGNTANKIADIIYHFLFDKQ